MACSRCVINTEFWRIIWVSWDIGALLNKTPPKRDGKTYDIVSWRWFAFQARWQYLGRHCLFIFDSFRKNEAKPCIKKAWQFLFIGITFYAFSPFMLALPFNQSYLPSKKGCFTSQMKPFLPCIVNGNSFFFQWSLPLCSHGFATCLNE